MSRSQTAAGRSDWQEGWSPRRKFMWPVKSLPLRVREEVRKEVPAPSGVHCPNQRLLASLGVATMAEALSRMLVAEPCE